MSSYVYEKSFDVVVVGGGVIGCSVAYHLAKKSGGKLKVAVLERNSVGCEASGGSAGMLAAQVEASEKSPFLDLALRSRALFAELSDELRLASGVDVAYSQSGILEIAFAPEEEAALRARAAAQRSEGLDCSWLSPDEVSARHPFLKKKSLGGFWVPQDGQVSANKLTAAFAESAKKLGVLFFEGENFDEVSLAGARLEFVETNLSKFYAERFVFAAGPWLGKITRGILPVDPVKGQILIFELPAAWRQAHPWRNPVYFGRTPGADPVNCYFVPKDDGHLLLGATMERRGFDRHENEAATKRMADYACAVFPELENFPYKGCWVGLRPGSPDKLPILGAVPGCANAFVAGGHLRNGILLAPVTGKVMAELLIDGKASFPLDPFSPSRFAK